MDIKQIETDFDKKLESDLLDSLNDYLTKPLVKEVEEAKEVLIKGIKSFYREQFKEILEGLTHEEEVYDHIYKLIKQL